MIIHLFPSHAVERGPATPSRPRPGYRWHAGYAQAFPNGYISTPMTRREWSAQARKHGAECRYYASEESARAASLA